MRFNTGASSTLARCSSYRCWHSNQNSDGTLQSRAIAGSLLTDAEEASAQVVRLVREGTVRAHDGSSVPIQAQSICFHGDTPGAPTILARSRERLAEAQVEVVPIPVLLEHAARA